MSAIRLSVPGETVSAIDAHGKQSRVEIVMCIFHFRTGIKTDYLIQQIAAAVHKKM